MTVTQEMIEEKAHEMAEMVRDYCRSQVTVWQEVPYWAQKARGRCLASGEGYWDILSELRGWHLMLIIDLATGEIHDGNRGLASDKQVGELAYKLERLDATALVAHLMREAQKPGDPRCTEERREDPDGTKYAVPRVFTREPQPTNA